MLRLIRRRYRVGIAPRKFLAAYGRCWDTLGGSNPAGVVCLFLVDIIVPLILVVVNTKIKVF